MKLFDIENIRLLNNAVIIKPLKELNDSIKIEGGGEIYIDTSFAKGQHSSVIAEVIKVPDTLLYSDHQNENSMPWDTDVEIQKGDIVWVSWNTIILAFKDDANYIKFIYNDEIYLIINYKDMFLALRKYMAMDSDTWENFGWEETSYTKYDGDICIVNMLNGYCLVEPVRWKNLPDRLLPSEIKELKEGKIINNNILNQYAPQYGIVRYTGVPNKQYLDDYKSDNIEVSNGDIIKFARNADIWFEYPLHVKFNPEKKVFYRMQRYLMEVVVGNVND